MAVEDRANLMARAVIDLLNAALRQPELQHQLVSLLRDEIANGQRVADREFDRDA